MDANIERAKSTIRALLNLAENNAATEGEIVNAITFARRLMDTHHLTEDECRNDPHSAAAQAEVMEQATVFAETRGLTSWERQLACFIDDLVGSVGHYLQRSRIVRRDGRVVFGSDGHPLERAAITFYGPAEDVQLAGDLFASLRCTIIAMARLKYGGALRGDGRNYSEGFVDGLFSKLHEARKYDSDSSTESRALIIRATEVALATRTRARDWLKTQGFELVSARTVGSGAYCPSATKAGYQDGRKADISATRKAKLGGKSQLRIGNGQKG